MSDKSTLPAPARRTCPACGVRGLVASFEYHQPPEGETHFASLQGAIYHRRYDRCPACGHFVGTQIDDPGLYTGDYVASTYGGVAALRRRFAQVMALADAQSDNKGRAARVERVARDYLDGARGSAGGARGDSDSARNHRSAARPTLLDIGAGLGVFPAEMRARGWQCTANDPDPTAIEHLRDDLGLPVIEGLFDPARCPSPFDLVTLNKVIEHVPDPVALVRQALAVVAPHGLLYVEVPDGDAAQVEGPGREEFFIDHPHVFSPRSLQATIGRAGAHTLVADRLREPSGKFTCFAFVRTAVATEAADRTRAAPAR